MIEGEIQNLSPQEVEQVLHAEVWEILTGRKGMKMIRKSQSTFCRFCN